MSQKITHGTATGYTHWGCRCASCRNAHQKDNEAVRDKARERAKTSPDLIPHGQISGYTYWGCRCPACKRAKAGSR